jgi:hypothetical protein
MIDKKDINNLWIDLNPLYSRIDKYLVQIKMQSIIIIQITIQIGIIYTKIQTIIKTNIYIHFKINKVIKEIILINGLHPKLNIVIFKIYKLKNNKIIKITIQ